jgi:hypothetical protein
MERQMKFTPAQIETLRNGYANIQTVDPTGPAFAKMRRLLDACDQPTLKMLAGANIKWISRLAINRVVKQ